MNLDPRSLTVPASRYGTRKAKLHAQSEANRIGRRVYLQFDYEGTFAICTRDRISLPNAPFFTFYPRTIEEG